MLTRVLNNPEHPILNLLIKIIDRIISLPTSTPLMKVLHGIELLIKKANEWQSYASKEASIQGQLDSLWGIVIRWRRIEIDCWSHLLEECSISFHETAIKDVILYVFRNCYSLFFFTASGGLDYIQF